MSGCLNPMDSSDINCLDKLGLIAGRGDFPLEVCRAVKRTGVRQLSVLAVYEDCPVEIENLADRVDWIYAGQLGRAIACLRGQGIENLLFAGQIKPSRLFRGLRPDWRALKLLSGLRERNAESIFGALAAEFGRHGIRVLPSTLFMREALAPVGILGRIKPGAGLWEDIRLGVRVARELGRLDIGQTVVVKRGTILAVEGFEGTDKAIRRGGELGHGGVTVAKMAKPGHDLRFDVPCIGLRTVESLSLAKARALAVQAGLSLFIRKAEVLAACDAAGIAVVGVDPADLAHQPA